MDDIDTEDTEFDREEEGRDWGMDWYDTSMELE
jgi:hypothetical protein